MTTNTNAAPDLKTVINFLMGDGPINGFQFGETPEGAGKYWWRKHLRAALATAAAAVPAIPDAITHTIQRALVKFSDSELERLRTLLEPENAAVAMFGMARIAAQQNIDDADAALNWLAAAPKAEPVQQPALWFRNLVGAEAKPNGQCYDVVFVDPKDERYQPLYAAAIDAARAKQEESK